MRDSREEGYNHAEGCPVSEKDKGSLAGIGMSAVVRHVGREDMCAKVTSICAGCLQKEKEGGSLRGEKGFLLEWTPQCCAD